MKIAWGIRALLLNGLQIYSVLALQDVFQVEAPLRASYEGASCQQVIVEHEFAASYGSPYVGYYAPPKNCAFTTTIFNMSVTSEGINYDRLGLIFFGDIEVWRTTTAMPTRTGIYWNYQKDMTVYDTLLRAEQKVIFEMDNIYDSVFTGAYNVTITALYYNDLYPEPLTPADIILPITSQSSAENASSVFSVPDGNATVSLSFPENVERAVVSIFASGNGAEEFWYANVPTEYEETFGSNNTLYGYGPWREVQLLIDGKLAGISWPFPTIFTGGISPGLWVPIVGVDTYDLPSFEIDISPWLGLLCNGHNHTFQLKVVGYDSETILGTVGSNWWITGAVFIWSDVKGSHTTGTIPGSSLEDPSFKLTPHVTTSSGDNTTLWFELNARRYLSHTGTITTSSGTRSYTWSQTLSYSNTQDFTNLGYNETLYQLTVGSSSYSPVYSKSGSHYPITNTFEYPIAFYQANVVSPDAEVTNNTLIAKLDRSQISTLMPILAYLTSPSSFHVYEALATRQNGYSIYYWNNTYYEFAGAIDPAVGTVGETEQWFSYAGPGFQGRSEPQQYGRHVRAIDGYEPVLVEDETYGHTVRVPMTEKVSGDGL